MTPRQDIQSFVDHVVERFNPTKVILFGSHAHGHATLDSDVDILVVLPHHGSPSETATKIRLACPRSFALDLLVRSPAALKKSVRDADPFFTDVLTKGLILHDASRSRVGR